MIVVEPVVVATRGSALALAQANAALAALREKFPRLRFEMKIIKTSGDKLRQPPDFKKEGAPSAKGLFTKELEVALLRSKADIAVHSLKDLPTALPAGLMLAGVAGKRADVRDVVVYRAEGGAARGFAPRLRLRDFPAGLIAATGSERRKAQLLALRPDFKAAPIRGNVPTRLEKVAAGDKIDLTVLAAAGLGRLDMTIDADGRLRGQAAPDGLCATILELDEMLPCVGQGAIGLEIREADGRAAEMCRMLNHHDTFQSVIAERAFLNAMGGGCQTPLGAHACVDDGRLTLRAVSFLGAAPRRAEAKGKPADAAALGESVAAQLL